MIQSINTSWARWVCSQNGKTHLMSWEIFHQQYVLRLWVLMGHAAYLAMLMGISSLFFSEPWGGIRYHTYIYIYVRQTHISIWVNYSDLSDLTGSWLGFEESSPNGCKFQSGHGPGKGRWVAASFRFVNKDMEKYLGFTNKFQIPRYIWREQIETSRQPSPMLGLMVASKRACPGIGFLN